MKHALLPLLFLVCGVANAATEQEQAAARAVISRFAGEAVSSKLILASCAEKDGCPTYSWRVADGALRLKGSSGVALCKAFYNFTTSQGAGIASWSGNRFALPSPLPEGAQAHGTSPVQHHQYFNVVTFGYSTAYWDWERWEQELDWMALHGIDMPLALVATEAISARVFRKLGLSDEEISAWFTGPAHLPWLRMGNISAHDGPLPQEWHEGQVALQHRILKRMRELGMTPICPGFCGFVPKAIKRHYPEAALTQTSWGGRFHNWMLTPDDPLFSRIGKMFIEEWEKEFGKNTHYLIDSFNEMELPFPPHGKPERYEMLARYGERVYQSLAAGSPGATWVMQGWMFGYQRDIWDARSLQALLSRVPDGNMLLLDMAVDYNRHFWKNGNNYELHKGFYGKGWVYSLIPNMGGKTGMTGMLEFYANGHLHALSYPGRGRLLGMGMAPEGIENNEVIYELASHAGWSAEPISLMDWLAQYNRCRYGCNSPGLMRYWQLMLQSAYGSFTDHPRYSWQRRPGSGARGSINTSADFHAAIAAFASCADTCRESPLYRADLMELVTASVGGRVEELMQACETATHEGRHEEAARLEGDITALMLGMDRLLASHPTHRLERWLTFARQHGSTTALRNYYEGNARRLVTIWGPPVDDYAAKVWSGLIRDYYLPRWQQYRQHGAAGLPAWEQNWVEQQRGLSPATPYADPVSAAQQLLAQAHESATRATQTGVQSAIAHWNAQSLGHAWQDWELTPGSSELKKASGLQFIADASCKGIEIDSLRIIMDGREILKLDSPGRGKCLTYRFTIPEDAQGNNECRLIIRARNTSKSSGSIILLP